MATRRSFDLQSARAETPGCAEVTHFNNAGSSLMPQPVLDASIAYLQLESRIGGYEAAEQSAAGLEHVYDAVASLLHCNRDEVALIENATRAWGEAFYSISFKPGDRILTTMNEYASNYISFLQVARKTGVEIEVIPDDEHGQVSLSALHNAIDDRTRLIAVTHIPMNGGLVNPVAEIGKIARAANVLYLVDACQSAGQLPLDVEAIGCDLLSATGRKFLRGPRGTGFLYVRRSVLDQLEPPMLDQHAAIWAARDRYELLPNARRFEYGETSFAARIGLGTAIDYLQQWDQPVLWRRIRDLAYLLRSRLSPLPGVIVRDRGITQCGIVTFTIEDQDPRAIQLALRAHKINLNVTRLAGTRLDMEARGLTAMLRASLHYYNTEEEIERFCAVLESLL